MPRKRINNNVKKIVLQYLDILKADRLPISHAMVFGSHAKGTARKDSDIDVVIVSPKLHNSSHSMRYLLHKAHELDMSQFYIEPHGFHPKEFVEENPIVWEIKKTGVSVL